MVAPRASISQRCRMTPPTETGAPPRALPRAFLGAASTWEPATQLPTLGTWNGWGSRLVRAPFGADDVEGDATLYLVALWLPVWPLCRYRAMRASDGAWRVFAAGPLRAVDWLRPLWWWAALAMILWAWGAIA